MSKQHNHKANKKKTNLVNGLKNSWLKKDMHSIAMIVYLVINVFDFILFPIWFAMLPVLHPGLPFVEWTPLTTKNGGLFHMAFGAILGVNAWKSQSFDQAFGEDGAAQGQEDQSSKYNQYNGYDRYSGYNQPESQANAYTPQGAIDPTTPYYPTLDPVIAQQKYDPELYAGPDNFTDWQGNQIKQQ